MSALGNFLLGSYITGFFFFLFFIDEMTGDSEYRTRSKAEVPHRIFAGILWPFAAICFFFVRLNLFIMGK